MRRLHKVAFFLGGYFRKKNKAQTILEYAAVVMCLTAALLAMQVYIKRGMQGRLRQLGDELGPQYAPRNTTGNHTLTYNTTYTTQVRTLSERQLSDVHGYDIDLDEDGVIEDDVFATETLSVIGTLIDTDGDSIPDTIVGESTTTQKGEEKVGE